MKVLLAVIAVALVGAKANADVKIGYVDMQKAIQTTKAGQKAKKDLEAEFEKRKKSLQSKEADLKKMGEELEKKAMVLSEDVRAKKQKEFQTSMMEFQQTVQKNQKEIQDQERKLTEPILKKLQTVIEDMAKKDNYTVILEKRENGVLWAQKELDITEQVVKAFEK
ncbi:MAG: OmpH family outer membrane protein [Bdellovibrionota bacterium]